MILQALYRIVHRVLKSSTVVDSMNDTGNIWPSGWRCCYVRRIDKKITMVWKVFGAMDVLYRATVIISPNAFSSTVSARPKANLSNVVLTCRFLIKRSRSQPLDSGSCVLYTATPTCLAIASTPLELGTRFANSHQTQLHAQGSKYYPRSRYIPPSDNLRISYILTCVQILR